MTVESGKYVKWYPEGFVPDETLDQAVDLFLDVMNGESDVPVDLAVSNLRAELAPLTGCDLYRESMDAIEVAEYYFGGEE